MIRHITADTAEFDWTRFDAAASLRAVLAVALSLAVGIALGHPREGMYVAYGAFSVGFGSFVRDRNATTLARLMTAVGIAVSGIVGHFAGQLMPTAIVAAAVWGMMCGTLMALSSAPVWIGTQWAVSLFLGIAYAKTAGVDPWGRALEMFGGGLLQTLMMWGFCRIGHEDCDRWESHPGADTSASLRHDLQLVTDWTSPVLRFALRVAVTLGVAEAFARVFGLSNGYWVPMTALIVVRPELHTTFSRGLARVGGTVGGAVVATMVVSYLHPNLWVLAALVLVCAWLCYNLLLVNYAIYTLAVTGYVVFLLSLAGAPAKVVVAHRVANTLIGAAVALSLRLLWPTWDTRAV
ncbi:MAG TPA: FUSC family protein [Terriglobales bacterium]